ncbi:2Fe-2S iron-sulfur cluster-binding protein [Nocardia nepalensis]|uniref:2Fe-2S iron-sulfur cluster-binding protein n=1 Tax=Nocardia nepalensis TaxID=3375448 RepID=UPI003B68351C
MRRWRRATVSLRYERFSPLPIVDGMVFTMQLGRGGPVALVSAHPAILDVVAEAVPGTSYSCRQGFCATSKVLAGAVERRDTAQHARGDTLICESRALRDGRLVLDIDPPATPEKAGPRWCLPLVRSRPAPGRSVPGRGSAPEVRSV